MGLSAIKSELKKLDKDKLIDLITDLCKKNKSVQEYFDFYANPNEDELFNKYRTKVYEAFFPKRGDKFNLKVGKQAINDFKKLGVSSDYLSGLMLFYVETGVEFTNLYGDVNESFYKSLATTFVDSLSLMQKEDLLDKYEKRVDKVVEHSSRIGWGFYDFLVQIWIDFYPIDDSDDEQQDENENGRIIKLN